MTAMCRWSGWPSGAPKSGRLDLRQPDPVRADRRFRLLSAHLEGRRRQARRRGGRPVWNPDVKTMYPDGFATRIVPEGPATAGLEDRFRPHFFGGVATVVGKLFTQVPPGCCDLRRKGFPAIAGGDADGPRSRPRRQGDRLKDRAGTRRPRDVVAQRLPFARGAARGAGTVPRHEGKRDAAEGRRRTQRGDGRRRTDDHPAPASRWIISRRGMPRRWRRSPRRRTARCASWSRPSLARPG